ncbi:uncharacterized protein SRS1_15585 [Sporisorium reilianum f. sp. reilianum]|uniref:Uncharacterized protein n=1 Tax=Sporisorium reilianum f. sp. reilianum TaxID=72559 RepID=A0A2N8UK60_9BASI|nr:uncharacterized protein SRS1_15585 [Sporisorium reilianum f. sp. reilianum]
MSAAPSQSPSPKRKAQQQQQQQQQTKIGGIGVLSSPKFSFRAALVQHKASKLASKSAVVVSDASTASQTESHQPSQSDSIARSIRSINNNASSIPSLKGRGRFNSASTDSAFTSTLPRRRHGDTASPEATRASSSLGKRPVDEAMPAAADGSMLSDFGPILRKSPASASSSGSVNKTSVSNSTLSRTATSKLPGPPSARTHWGGAAASSLKSLPSPSASKAPRKIARSDSVAEVHAASAQATPNNSTVSPASAHSDKRSVGHFGSVRNRTISASARPLNSAQQQPQSRPKIGTLPRPQAKTAPVKTLLDEKPIQQLRPALLSSTANDQNDEFGSDDDEDEDDDDEDDDVDQDELEGPDVSRIRTRRVASQRGEGAVEKADSTQTKMLPPASSAVSTSSRIPSFGSNSTAKSAGRPHRRSSSNSLNASLATAANEKENISQMSTTNAGSKRHSVGAGFGAPGRMRSSLPLAVSQPAPQTKANSPAQTPAELEVRTETARPEESIPASPTKTSSLSALRSRGLQTDSTRDVKSSSGTESALPSRSSRQDLGIRASIIQANPVHPSILALQAAKATQHQPISTPEALIKAKKRLSGALLSSSSSSSALSSVGSIASPSERASSLARSSSINKFGAQNKLQSTPRAGLKQLQTTQPTAAAPVTPSASTSTLPRSGSRSPIKSSLLLFSNAIKQESADKRQSDIPAASSSRKLAETPSSTLAQPNRVLSSSEIDANLLASLKVVAQKANLNLVDLLDDERQQQQQQQQQQHQPDAGDTASAPSQVGKAPVPARSQREASEELEAWAGDVSVDLMALDLAAGSPVSDVSMLRSPVLRDGAYLDTPPSVLAAVNSAMIPSHLGDSAVEGIEHDDDQEAQITQIDDDGTDTSCASPSLRAAAAMRAPRRPTVAVNESTQETIETPVRRQGYRNVPSIPSTPFPSAASAHPISPSKSARAYPPSAVMSAKTRSHLKKALRESLGLEAHFASIKLAPHNDDGDGASSAVRLRQVDAEADQEELLGTSAKPDMRKSISAMLLTDDDRYLDELVSAVARIGLEDLAPEQPTPPNEAAAPSEPVSPVQPPEAVTPPLDAATSGSALHAQLSAALSELAALRTQLQHSQTHTSELEAQLATQAAAAARTTRTQALLETDLATLKGEMAGAEWGKARTSWASARSEALAELEEVRVQKDVVLVLGAQMGVWERMIRARV